MEGLLTDYRIVNTVALTVTIGFGEICFSHSTKYGTLGLILAAMKAPKLSSDKDQELRKL